MLEIIVILLQVEKSLEIKNVVGKALQRGRKQESAECSHTSMLNGFYPTTQHQGECGHIKGHAYSISLVQH